VTVGFAMVTAIAGDCVNDFQLGIHEDEELSRARIIGKVTNITCTCKVIYQEGSGIHKFERQS
jgi:hypothetical protein